MKKKYFPFFCFQNFSRNAKVYYLPILKKSSYTKNFFLENILEFTARIFVTFISNALKNCFNHQIFSRNPIPVAFFQSSLIKLQFVSWLACNVHPCMVSSVEAGCLRHEKKRQHLKAHRCVEYICAIISFFNKNFFFPPFVA